jgi:hypothetical protein
LKGIDRLVGTLVIYDNDDDTKSVIISNINGKEKRVEIPKAYINVNIIENMKYDDIDNFNDSGYKGLQIVLTIDCMKKNGKYLYVLSQNSVSNSTNEELLEELNRRNALPVVQSQETQELQEMTQPSQGV